MSNMLEDVAKALFNGQLPAIWRRLAPTTLKSLGNWISHFERRYQQYRDWVDKGEPTVMWLSGLHIPESYLTALVQTTCELWIFPFLSRVLDTCGVLFPGERSEHGSSFFVVCRRPPFSIVVFWCPSVCLSVCHAENKKKTCCGELLWAVRIGAWGDTNGVCLF